MIRLSTALTVRNLHPQTLKITLHDIRRRQLLSLSQNGSFFRVQSQKHWPYYRQQFFVSPFVLSSILQGFGGDVVVFMLRRGKVTRFASVWSRGAWTPMGKS